MKSLTLKEHHKSPVSDSVTVYIMYHNVRCQMFNGFLDRVVLQYLFLVEVSAGHHYARPGWCQL